MGFLNQLKRNTNTQSASNSVKTPDESKIKNLEREVKRLTLALTQAERNAQSTATPRTSELTRFQDVRQPLAQGRPQSLFEPQKSSPKTPQNLLPASATNAEPEFAVAAEKTQLEQLSELFSNLLRDSGRTINNAKERFSEGVEDAIDAVDLVLKNVLGRQGAGIALISSVAGVAGGALTRKEAVNGFGALAGTIVSAVVEGIALDINSQPAEIALTATLIGLVSGFIDQFFEKGYSPEVLLEAAAVSTSFVSKAPLSASLLLTSMTITAALANKTVANAETVLTQYAALLIGASCFNNVVTNNEGKIDEAGSIFNSNQPNRKNNRFNNRRNNRFDRANQNQSLLNRALNNDIAERDGFSRALVASSAGLAGGTIANVLLNQEEPITAVVTSLAALGLGIFEAAKIQEYDSEGAVLAAGLLGLAAAVIPPLLKNVLADGCPPALSVASVAVAASLLKTVPLTTLTRAGLWAGTGNLASNILADNAAVYPLTLGLIAAAGLVDNFINNQFA